MPNKKLPFSPVFNELSQRLVRYCSVEDATLEGPFAVDDSVVNNVRALTRYVSQCAEKMLHMQNPSHNNNFQAFEMLFGIF